MNNIKKGDIVGRKSYGKDIIFVVKNIIESKTGKIAILKGLTQRIEADSNIKDLELIEKKELKEHIKKFNNALEKKIEKSKIYNEDINYKIGLLTKNKRTQEKIITG